MMQMLRSTKQGAAHLFLLVFGLVLSCVAPTWAAPGSPLTLVGSASTITASPGSNTPASVAVLGNYAYVLNTRGGTNGGAIVAFDISNPARPAVAAVTALPDGSYPVFLAASGGLVTVYNMNQQYANNTQVATLATYDAATPTAALPLRSSIGIPGNAGAGLSMTGTTAYTLSDNFGGGSGTVAVVDLSTPASPVLRQNASTGAQRYTPTAFAVNGSLALAASLAYNPVNVMSLTATTATKRGEVLVGVNKYPNSNNAVALGSTLGLALNFNNVDANNKPLNALLQVLDLRTPNPTQKGSLVLDAAAKVLTMVDDHFAYVLNQGALNTLQVIDLSDPNAPAAVGSLSTSGKPVAINVVGNYAYVTCSDNTLRVFALNLAPTLTAISPSAELPGNTITLTGSYFAANSAVSFGGVAAANVVYNSSTSLTATVPAGVAAGSSSVVVGTSSGVSTSPPAFAVLEVYAPGTACTAAVPATASLNDGQWHYLLSAAGQVVLAYNYTGASLGDFSVEALGADPSATVRNDQRGRYYLDRNWHLTASGGRFDGRTVALRFYGLTSEFAHFQTARPAARLASLYATQYSGSNEDCDLANDDPAGERRALPAPASAPSGATWFVASTTVADHFSEFYLTDSNTPLPVVLTSFTAAAGPAAVQLAWTTASELNSQYFAVERSLDGQVFSPLAQVAAAGSSTQARTYRLTDAALPAQRGVLYYRLRQVDADGTTTYSPSRAVTLGGAARALQVFPNPASTQLTVVGTAAHAPISIYNATGQLVQQVAADAAGVGQLALPAGLRPGIYLVRGGTQTGRFSVE
jgi:hypothetical protein